jgi:hypothetical protein
MVDTATATKILDAVDRRFDEQLQFTSELVSLPSLRGQEATAQDFMARAFRERELVVDRWKIVVDDIRHLPGFSPVAVSMTTPGTSSVRTGPPTPRAARSSSTAISTWCRRGRSTCGPPRPSARAWRTAGSTGAAAAT